MSIFGRIVTDDMVEDAVLATLKKWTSTYLSEVETNAGKSRGHYARPRSWEVRNDFDKWPEDMLPAVIVVSTGIDEPSKEGSGQFRAPFAIGVVAVVESINQLETRRYAYRMGGALRTTLIQNQSLDGALGGTVRGVTWLGVVNNEIPQPEAGQRTIWASRQVFMVEVGDVVTQGVGPARPDADPLPDFDPWPDWPETEDPNKVTATIEHMEEE